MRLAIFHYAALVLTLQTVAGIFGAGVLVFVGAAMYDRGIVGVSKRTGILDTHRPHSALPQKNITK